MVTIPDGTTNHSTSTRTVSARAVALVCTVGAALALSTGTAHAQPAAQGSVSANSLESVAANPMILVNYSVVLPIGSAIFAGCVINPGICPR